MMIETHRQIEFAAEFVGERTSVERRRKIYRDDRALVVKTIAPTATPMPRGFRVAAVRADRIDFLIALMMGANWPVPFRQRNPVLADDRAIEGDEARLYCVRHDEQHPADRACAWGKPEGSSRLATASLGPARLGFDKHIVVDQRLDYAGNGRPVDTRAASQFCAARWSQIEQSLYDEPNDLPVPTTDDESKDRCTFSDAPSAKGTRLGRKRTARDLLCSSIIHLYEFALTQSVTCALRSSILFENPGSSSLAPSAAAPGPRPSGRF